MMISTSELCQTKVIFVIIRAYLDISKKKANINIMRKPAKFLCKLKIFDCAMNML